MYYLKLTLKLIAGIIEMIRGPRSLREITEPRTQLESLVGYSIEGYVTTIHCQERKYLCHYHRWPWFNKVVSTYFVFSTVTGSAPGSLVDACSMERSFPALLFSGSSNIRQKEAAIEAYIDLLIENLKSSKKVVS